ncbi:MAG: hypothetical protein Q8R11_03620 [bacterium]|nr:hypothetical protein [bacterium]
MEKLLNDLAQLAPHMPLDTRREILFDELHQFFRTGETFQMIIEIYSLLDPQNTGALKHTFSPELRERCWETIHRRNQDGEISDGECLTYWNWLEQFRQTEAETTTDYSLRPAA